MAAAPPPVPSSPSFGSKLLSGLGSAALGGIPVVGDLFSGKAQRKAQEQQLAEARRIDDLNQQDYNNWIQGIQPQLNSIYGMASQPQVTNTSGSQAFNQAQRVVTNAEDRPLTNMLRSQYEQSLAEPTGELFKGYAEQSGRDYAQQAREVENAIRNRAAQTGAGNQQSKLDSILLSQPARAQHLQTLQQLPMMKEQLMQGRRAAAGGFLNPRLGSNTSGTSTSQSMTSGPADIGAMLGALQFQKPRERTILA